MKRVFSAVLAGAAFCGCVGAPVRVAQDSVQSEALGYADFSRYLDSRNHAPVYDIEFQRDSTGSKIFVRFFFRKGNVPEYRTLVVTGAGTREIAGYPIVWYNDESYPVFRVEGAEEWYEGEGPSSRLLSQRGHANFIFQGGATIPYEKVSGIRGVLGANLVLLQFRDDGPPERLHLEGTNYITIEHPRKTPWMVSKPESPQHPLFQLPADFRPDRGPTPAAVV